METIMTLNAAIIAVTFILMIFLGHKILSFTAAIEDEPVQAFPINYPIEPMFQNYISIAKDIDEADSRKELYSAYVRIIIFQGCYNDSASFTSELIEAYHNKEILIFS